MDFTVVVRAREDGSDPEDVLRVASLADHLGFEELWVGEGPTWDAFTLATAVGLATRRVALTVGPVAVAVRDPATIARGAASVAALTGRTVGVALGTASVRVVEKLHGRSRRRPAATLADSAAALRDLIEIPRHLRYEGDPDAAFLRKLSPPNGPLTVAAFGDRAVQVAADHADRMLLDLVSPEQVAVLRSKLESASTGPRPMPRLAAWLPAAIDPNADSLRQVMRSIAGYLTVSGYREVFEAAGFGEAVQKAEAGANADELVVTLPVEAAQTVGLVGDTREVGERLEAYAAAGLDEVAIVPATAGDPGAERTLAAFRSFG